jgi:hypothetical protein
MMLIVDYDSMPTRMHNDVDCELRYADSGAFSLYIQVTGHTTPQVAHCRRPVILDLVGD